MPRVIQNTMEVARFRVRKGEGPLVSSLQQGPWTSTIRQDDVLYAANLDLKMRQQQEVESRYEVLFSPFTVAMRASTHG